VLSSAANEGWPKSARPILCAFRRLRVSHPARPSSPFGSHRRPDQRPVQVLPSSGLMPACRPADPQKTSHEECSWKKPAFLTLLACTNPIFSNRAPMPASRPQFLFAALVSIVVTFTASLPPTRLSRHPVRDRTSDVSASRRSPEQTLTLPSVLAGAAHERRHLNAQALRLYLPALLRSCRLLRSPEPSSNSLLPRILVLHPWRILLEAGKHGLKLIYGL